MPEDRRPDVLDYLYEELPPDQMAAARDAIQADPDSLDDMRAIKEAVLAYRALSRPTPPAGLAARVAAAARNRAGNAEPPPDDGLEAPAAGDEIERELAARRKRSWLFHPAWTVAAGVILVFAVLFHVSPRRTVGQGQPAPAQPASSKAVPAAEARVAATPAPRAAPARREPAEPVPEVEQRGDDDAQPAAPHPASLSIADTLVSEEPIAAPPPAAAIALPPANADAAALSAGPPVAGADASVPAPFPPPSEPERAPPGEAPPAAMFAAPPAPAAGPAAIPDTPHEDAAMRQQEYGALDATPEEILETAGEHSGEDVRIVDLLRGREPPPLIELSEPFDKEALVQNLVFLIGLHMGEKEFPEARAAIELLRRYDPAKAGEMAIALLRMEDAAEQSGEQPGVPAESAGTGENQAAPSPPPETGKPAEMPHPDEPAQPLPPEADAAGNADAILSDEPPAVLPVETRSTATHEQETPVAIEAAQPASATQASPGIMGPSIPWPPPLVLHSAPEPYEPPPVVLPPQVAPPPVPPRRSVPQTAPVGRQLPPRLLLDSHR